MTTSMTKYAPKGSMADRINEMSNVNSTGMGVMKGAGKGGAKSTTGGADTGKDAKNVVDKLSCNPREIGPSASCVGVGYRKGKKSY